MKSQVVVAAVCVVVCTSLRCWAQDQESSAKTSGVASLEKARALYELGDYRAAVENYDGLLQQSPENAPTLAEKASCLNQLHRHNEALLASEKAIQIDRMCILAHAARGDALTFLGRRDEATKAYSAGEGIEPQNARAFVHRGALRLARNSPQSAIEDLSKAIEKDRKLSLAYYTRAQGYEATGDAEKAVQDYAEAIAVNPQNAQAYCSRGTLLARRGQEEKALADWNKAIEMSPHFAMAFYNRGTFYGVNRNDYTKEIVDCTKAIELDPKYKEAYLNRGHAYKGLGQYEKAIADFTKTIELDPNYAAAFQARGVTHAKKENYAAAKKDWERAVELDPTGDTGKRARSNLQALKNAGY